MRYSEPLNHQILIFVRSLGSGIIIGVMYTILSSLRSILGTSMKAYVMCDGAFCILAGTYAFFFGVVYNSGVIRFNILFSQVAGALLFYFALGRYLCSITDRAAVRIRKVIRLIFLPFIFLYRRLSTLLGKTFLLLKNSVGSKLHTVEENIRKKSDNIYKNTCKKIKNLYTKE